MVLKKWKDVNPIVKNKVYAVLSIFMLIGIVKVFQLQEYIALGFAFFFIFLSNYFWRKSKKLLYKNEIKERKNNIRRLENREKADDENERKEKEEPIKKIKEVKRLKWFIENGFLISKNKGMSFE